MDQNNDGWEDVTDAREVKALVGVKGLQQQAKGLPQARPGANTAAAASVGGVMETPARRDGARSSLALIARLQPAIDRVRHLQETTLAPSGVAGLAEYNPFSSANQEYDAAVAGLTALARPATRSPGEGSMSDFESRLAVAALPNRWKRDTYNHEAVDGLQRLVDTSSAWVPKHLPSASPRHLQAA
jgi:hypothetical protein